MENKYVLIIIAVLIMATVASFFAIATMSVNPAVKPPINATGVNDTDNGTVATVVNTDSNDEEDNDTADEASDGTSFDDEDTTFPEDDPYYYPEEDVEYPEDYYEYDYYY